MLNIWNRIKNYLESKDSNLSEELSEPIQDNFFREYLSSLSIPLDDFYESFRVHDGQKYGYYALAYPWQFLNSERIQENADRLYNLFPFKDFTDGKTAYGSVKEDAWNRKWLPFASDESGNFLCVDYDPDEGGNIGQVILWASDPAYVEVIAPSYRTWLEQYLSDLEAGKYKWDPEQDEWSRVD